MPPFMSTSKAVGSLMSRKNGVGHLIRRAKSNGQFRRLDQFRFFSSIAGIETPSVKKLTGWSREDANLLSGSLFDRNTTQRRRFLGCGDGEEGSVLSKFYEERRVMGSDILKRYPDGSFDAELEIGFKFLVESYVSHLELERPKFVKSTVSESKLFDHLINIWEFNPGPVPGSGNLYFLVDFKFQSPLYRQVAAVFFKEVVSRLVGSFSERCRLIYGPGVPVFENSYERRA